MEKIESYRTNYSADSSKSWGDDYIEQKDTWRDWMQGLAIAIGFLGMITIELLITS